MLGSSVDLGDDWFVIDSCASGHYFFAGNYLAKILVTYLQHATLHFGFKDVHRAGWWPCDALSICRKRSGMAWANEFILIAYPTDRATQMWTDGRQDTELPSLRWQHVNRGLRGSGLPGISPFQGDGLCGWLGK